MAGTGLPRGKPLWKRSLYMGSHLDETIKACDKALDEAKKLEAL
jgi:hypothetical protein